MVSDRRVPEFRITQSTSVTFCIISVTKFPETQQGNWSVSLLYIRTLTFDGKINHNKKKEEERFVSKGEKAGLLQFTGTNLQNEDKYATLYYLTVM